MTQCSMRVVSRVSCKYRIVSCFITLEPYLPVLKEKSATCGRRTLKTAVRNFRVSSSLIAFSSFPYMSNTARAFASSSFPQNVLMPLLVMVGESEGQEKTVSRFKPTSAHDYPGFINSSYF